MTTNSYPQGQAVRFTFSFTDSAGAAADPTTVKFRYAVDQGVPTTLTYGVDAALIRDSIGAYHVDLLLSEPGTWGYRVEGAGAVATAEDRLLFVRKPIV